MSKISSDGNKLPDFNQAQNLLTNQLKTLKIVHGFNLSWQQPVYLKAEQYYLPAPNPEEADHLKIGFNPEINEYQLVGINPREPLISAIYNKNNLMEIKNNLPEGSGSPSGKKVCQKESKETRLFIRRLLFEKGRLFVKVVPMSNKEYQLQMGVIEMRNLRGTPVQIAKQVISKLTKQALSQVQKKGVDQAGEKIRKKIKSQLDFFK